MSLEGTSTRRGFLKQAGLVTGGAALASSALGAVGTSSAAAAPIEFDQTADVVILGAGGAGLSAAIEARNAGSSVIVLEKAATAGGTTARSGGIIQAAGTSQQKQFTKYQDDTPEKHAQTWMIEGEGLLDEDLIRDLANGAPANIAWLVDKGVVITGLYGHCHVPYLDKAGVMADRIHLTEGGGSQVAAKLLAAAEAAGATIQYSVEAKRLVTDEAGMVVGVEAHGTSGDFAVGANQGVVIATSSFDHNAEMAKALSAQQYWDITSQLNLTAPTNTGDGIRMGMELGAALAGFGGTIDYEATTGLGGSNAGPQLACLLVNGRGQRFVCEDATYAFIMRGIFQQQAMHQAPTYLILDSRGVKGKASPWADPAKLAAAVKSGQLVKAKSQLELARKIKVSAVNLRSTLASWNDNITRFHRDVEYQRNTQLVHINRAPYYAYKPMSANLGSIGGLKIDVQTRVIDVNGNPIPHLFAGGMATGGWIGPYYPGSGTAICGAIHWGRKAGVAAASVPV